MKKQVFEFIPPHGQKDIVSLVVETLKAEGYKDEEIIREYDFYTSKKHYIIDVAVIQPDHPKNKYRVAVECGGLASEERLHLYKQFFDRVVWIPHVFTGGIVEKYVKDSKVSLLSEIRNLDKEREELRQELKDNNDLLKNVANVLKTTAKIIDCLDFGSVKVELHNLGNELFILYKVPSRYYFAGLTHGFSSSTKILEELVNKLPSYTLAVVKKIIKERENLNIPS